MTVIYVLAAFAVGFLFGSIFEVFIDKKTIREVTAKNVELETENTLLLGKLADAEKVVRTEVVISDDTVGKDVDYSKDW